MKKILIDSIEGGTRLAVLRESLLVGYECEHVSHLPQKGNVHLGVVFRVDDSLQAVFVEYLPGEYGFLPFSEIPVAYFELLEEVKKRAIEEDKHLHLYKNFNATEVIKKGLVLLVQVTKEKRRGKDVTLTAYVRLPNRYCVFMPFSKDIVLSKQLSDEVVATRLKEIASKEMGKEKYGVVFRSYCENADEKNIINDCRLLVSEWKRIVALKNKSKEPRLVFSEASLVKKILRDSYDGNVGEVVVNHKGVYEEVVDFIKNSLYFENPNVTLYTCSFPLFDKYKVESQVESLYEDSVPLRGGGYIVINNTEALTAIDVNSGRMKKENNIEETAYRVNMDAVSEIVRHLEIRGIAGIIVIDFIDMNNAKYVSNVERALVEAFKKCKSRIQVTPINKFGLITVSKQRTKNNIADSHMLKCQHCEGKGKVLKLEHQARKVLSGIYTAPRSKGIVVTAHPELAVFIFGEYRRMLIQAEEFLGVSVFLKIDEKISVGKGFEITFQDKQANVPMVPENRALTVLANQTDKDEKKNSPNEIISRRSWLLSWIKRITG